MSKKQALTKPFAENSENHSIALADRGRSEYGCSMSCESALLNAL